MTRRWRKRVVGLVVVTFVVALFGGTSLAYFTAIGKGSAASGVSTLKHTTITTATPAVGGTVTLAWGAVTSPDSNPVSYSVKRDGGPAEGTCAPPESPTSSLTCVDKGVGPGPHNYVVTAHWRTWETDSEPKTVNVTIGAATHFALTAATTSPVAGAADNLTIAAKDSAGTTVTTYTGSKVLAFSGAAASPGGTAATVSNSSGTATAFGVATTITFASGVAIVSTTKNGVMRLYRAGPANISVTDGTLSTEQPVAFSVSTSTFSKLALAPQSTTPLVGAEDDLTVTAQDAYGNTITSYEGTKTLTFTGGTTSPGGNAATVSDGSGEPVPFATPTPILFEAGVASVEGSSNGEMRLYKTGAQSIKVAEGAIVSSVVTVTPVAGSAVRFGFAASTLTPAAGGSVSLTTTAQDTYGNTATGYAGVKNLIFAGAVSSPSGTAPTVSNSSGSAVAFGTTVPITFANGVATVSSTKNGVMKIYKAGPASVTVTDGTISSVSSLALTVSNAALSKFVLAVDSTAPTTGAADDLTVTAQDAYGNLAVTQSGSKSLVFSGGTTSSSGNAPTVTNAAGTPVAFGTATAIEFEAGVATVEGSSNGEMRLYKVGIQPIKVNEGSIASAIVNVSPTAGPAAKFGLTASSSSFTASTSVNLTTTAQDGFGNTAITYTGPSTLTFSGALASPTGTLPTVANSAGTATAFGQGTTINFTNGVAAVSSTKNGVMKLYSSGPTAISVSDGTISTAAPTNVTVTATTATRLAFDEMTVSNGTVAAGCLFACAVTGLGNSGTIQAGLAVTDNYGNIVSNIGTGHSAAVTVVSGGGAVTEGAVAFPTTGLAESATRFTYTAQPSGAYTASLKAATTAGAAYTNATATATR